MSRKCQNLDLDVDAINNFKKKIIKDYKVFINALFKGYKINYNQILSEISFLDVYQDVDNQHLIYEYYTNHGM